MKFSHLKLKQLFKLDPLSDDVIKKVKYRRATCCTPEHNCEVVDQNDTALKYKHLDDESIVYPLDANLSLPLHVHFLHFKSKELTMKKLINVGYHVPFEYQGAVYTVMEKGRHGNGKMEVENMETHETMLLPAFFEVEVKPDFKQEEEEDVRTTQYQSVESYTNEESRVGEDEQEQSDERGDLRTEYSAGEEGSFGREVIED